MTNSFLLQILRAIDPSEHGAVRRFLQSPFFNRRSDVIQLFDLLVKSPEPPGREALFAALYPGRPFHNLTLNHTFSYLTERLEQYLALVEMQRDGQTERLYRVRAFRRRGLSQLFERDAHLLEKSHLESPQRHAGWHLFHYLLQNEIFSHRIVQRREGATNLSAASDALSQFFLLDNLRWACTAESLRSVGGETYSPPLADAVQQLAESCPPDDNPSLALLYQSWRVLRDPEDRDAFHLLEQLLLGHPDIFPPAESRDIHMAAINFCIRRQNRGERDYARTALELYRRALERGILHENGVLPTYTYNNIHLLAQVTGETNWAQNFLEQYREALPPGDRDNIYRYNLAIFYYRAADYGHALELLRTLDFPEVFMALDVRRMLLKSYYELGEWLSLASLLDSFSAFLRRQKTLGYHRESYRNLIRFTQKLAKRGPTSALAGQIKACPAVAEREWLLGKIKGKG
ncbi:MAG: hypothetical protein JNL02_11380 [Saprospiraceae bacterium]|nr:hypothetical protein [Saprospiraceae bacterium]